MSERQNKRQASEEVDGERAEKRVYTLKSVLPDRGAVARPLAEPETTAVVAPEEEEEDDDWWRKIPRPPRAQLQALEAKVSALESAASPAAAPESTPVEEEEEDDDDDDYWKVGTGALAELRSVVGGDLGEMLPMRLQPLLVSSEGTRVLKRPVETWRADRVQAMLTLARLVKSPQVMKDLLDAKLRARPKVPKGRNSRKKRNGGKKSRGLEITTRPPTVAEIEEVCDDLAAIQEVDDEPGSGDEYE